ncbi:MAG: proline--tRNA ligase [Myxococcales bacterium]|nr:proline--tRNA ligase [Myxococcales bacterium]
MRYTKAFIPTLKEVPKEAIQPSHILLLRGGFIRMVGAGIYELLPLGLRVLQKISGIVREEMDRADAQELLLPAFLPAQYFQESGRWETFGAALLRLKDRRGNDYHLGPTHEEIITDLVRREIRSYRQLPLNLYQIQMKFRDEPRPRAGILRGREFLMKDAYSFDTSEEAAERSYAQMREAYHAIFGRLGLEYRIVQADSGAMGGSTSAEFQVLAETGEDAIVACTACEYAANVEVAEARIEAEAEIEALGLAALEKVHTPGVGSIEAVVAFLRAEHLPALEANATMKSLVYTAGDGLVLAVVRGDHEVNEIKLARHLGQAEVQLASDAEVERATGASVGFAGPIGFEGRVLVDPAVTRIADGVCGANERDHHFAHVRFGRDFEGEQVDLRTVRDGDPCPRCAAPLRSYRGIEGGHIFILGTHYSAKMGATFLDEAGEERPVVMGCYGIGVSRLMAAAIEQHHDADGMRWPMPIAPYQVLLTPIGKGEEALSLAARLHDSLQASGVEVLLDDRGERPGVKFKDADLIGIPIRVTIGKRGLDSGALEVKLRDQAEAQSVPIDELVQHLCDRVVALGGRLRSLP